MNKNNKSWQSFGNAQTMNTMSGSQTNLNNLEVPAQISDLRLNQVRKLNKQQEENLHLLRSRLNHIATQERNSVRNINKTESEIQQLINSKSQACLDQIRIAQSRDEKEQKFRRTQEKTTNCRSARDLRLQNIQQQKEVYSLVHQVKNKNDKTLHYEKKGQVLSAIYRENASSHKLIRNQYLIHQQMKQRQEEEKKLIGHQNYHNKLLHQGEIYRYTQETISQIETEESRRLLLLRQTQQRERSVSVKKEEVKKMPIETFSPDVRKNLFRIT